MSREINWNTHKYIIVSDKNLNELKYLTFQGESMGYQVIYGKPNFQWLSINLIPTLTSTLIEL